MDLKAEVFEDGLMFCFRWQNLKRPFKISKGQSVLFLLGKEKWKFAAQGLKKKEKKQMANRLLQMSIGSSGFLPQKDKLSLFFGTFTRSN